MLTVLRLMPIAAPVARLAHDPSRIIMKRLAIAFFYDKDGVVDDYMLLLVAELGNFVDKTVFISNGVLTQESEIRLKGVVQDILVRENEGFDVWAYKVALEYVGYETLA